MGDSREVVIFCASADNTDNRYEEAGAHLVERLCKEGYGIVSGGSFRGLMGVVADNVVRFGGHHRGVIPHFMSQYVYPQLDETNWTDTMSQRKEKMRENTIAAVALPGGIGTMDELMETYTLAKLGRYSGKVLALNTDGFYADLKNMLDFFVRKNLLSVNDRNIIKFADTPEELMAFLNEG